MPVMAGIEADVKDIIEVDDKVKRYLVIMSDVAIYMHSI